jgi:hypothetical protein
LRNPQSIAAEYERRLAAAQRSAANQARISPRLNGGSSNRGLQAFDSGSRDGRRRRMPCVTKPHSGAPCHSSSGGSKSFPNEFRIVSLRRIGSSAAS